MGTRLLLALVFAACLSSPAAAGSDDKGGTGSSVDIWQQDTLTGDWGGARTALANFGVTVAVSEESEVWGNLRGGVQIGAAYDGLTISSLTFDLAKLLNWQGATLFAESYQIHGYGPNSLVGSQQLVSDIEAVPSTRLYQLWIEQALFEGRATIRIGQEGVNDEFMTSKASEIFLNGSFGFPDLAQRDLPGGGPNYPLPTPMVRAKVQITGQLSYIGAVFNGSPVARGEDVNPGEEDPQYRDLTGTGFRLQDPPLIVNELWYRVGEDKASAPLPGIYKLGAWVHTDSFGLSKDNYTGLAIPFTLAAPVYKGNFSVYALADQMVWRKPGTDDEGVTLFGLIMGAPDDRNASDLYAECGVSVKGMIEGRPDDHFGLGLAYAHTSDAFRRWGEESIALTGDGKLYAPYEAIIEATYQYQLAPWWNIQPDIQYVINPGASLPPDEPGVTTVLKNALVIGVRTKIDF